ncbi:MAG: tetratricopeptide repeat protein [Chlamydiales bacterium]|nr:tetratricopeptide repeat protein [Chlamydiales bacterium]
MSSITNSQISVYSFNKDNLHVLSNSIAKKVGAEEITLFLNAVLKKLEEKSFAFDGSEVKLGFIQKIRELKETEDVKIKKIVNLIRCELGVEDLPSDLFLMSKERDHCIGLNREALISCYSYFEQICSYQIFDGGGNFVVRLSRPALDIFGVYFKKGVLSYSQLSNPQEVFSELRAFAELIKDDELIRQIDLKDFHVNVSLQSLGADRLPSIELAKKYLNFINVNFSVEELNGNKSILIDLNNLYTAFNQIRNFEKSSELLLALREGVSAIFVKMETRAFLDLLDEENRKAITFIKIEKDISLRPGFFEILIKKFPNARINLEENQLKKMLELNQVSNSAEVWAFLGERLNNRSYLEKASSLAPESLIVLRLFARFLLISGEWELALEKIQTALKISPKDSISMGLLANCYSLKRDAEKNGRLDEEIERLYWEGFRLNPKEPAFLIECAKFLMTKNRLDVAKRLLLYLKENFNNYYLVYLNLGQCLSRGGDYTEGIKYLEKALALSPYSDFTDLNSRISMYERLTTLYRLSPLMKSEITAIYFGFGLCYKGRQEYDKAISYFKKALDLSNNDSRIISIIGDCYFQKGDFDKAKSYFVNAEKSNPNEPSNLVCLANFWLKSGKVETAISYFGRALTHNPHYTPALSQYGALLFEKGSLDKAKECLERAIKEDPRDIYSLFHYAEYLRGTGDLLNAKKYYQSILKIRKSELIAFFRFVSCLSKSELEDQCRELVKEVSRGENSDNLICLGVCYAKLGNFKQAENLFKHELAYSDRHSKLFLANVLYQKNKYDEALHYLQQVVNLPFSFCEEWKRKKLESLIHRSFGDCFYSKRNNQWAKFHYIRALSFDPSDLDTLSTFLGLNSNLGHNLCKKFIEELLEEIPNQIAVLTEAGKSYSALGCPALAKEKFLKGLSLEPDNRFCLEGLASCLIKEMNYNEAASIIKRLVDCYPNFPYYKDRLIECENLREEAEVQVVSPKRKESSSSEDQPARKKKP